MNYSNDKFFLVSAVPESLINFRKEFILDLVNTIRVDLSVVMPNSSNEVTEEFKDIGVNAHFVDFFRTGLNPLLDIKTIFSLIFLFFRQKPDYVMAYTIKPVVYSGIACFFNRKCEYYPLITGLGYAFQKGSFKKSLLNIIAKYLYKIALLSAKKVIFQNQDNLNYFVDNSIVPRDKCYVVNGSGVSTNQFFYTPPPSNIKFLLVARLLHDKGIVEFLKAAKIVKMSYPNVVFDLLGPFDSSPNSIKPQLVYEWDSEGIINYLGVSNDVRPFLADSSVFVLPSYHEGMPRSVLEAMSMGKPILTTDVEGCKDTVINGVNGWLVNKADVSSLVSRIIWFIENSSKIENMGIESRKIACEKFDVQKVNNSLFKILGFVA